MTLRKRKVTSAVAIGVTLAATLFAVVVNAPLANAAGDPVLVGAGDIATAALPVTRRPPTCWTGSPVTCSPPVTPPTPTAPARTTPTATRRPGAATRRAPARPRQPRVPHPGASGYFNYFGAAAGTPGKGYYRYDHRQLARHRAELQLLQRVGCAAGSTQEQWLRSDLAANTQQCTPPSGTTPASPRAPATARTPSQAALPGAVRLPRRRHPHRAQPQLRAVRPDGRERRRHHPWRAAVRGRHGGAGHNRFGTIQTDSQARNGDTYGVLKLTLHASSYDWQFVPEAGKTYSDSGTTACH